ncbi:P-loop NTPase fold protein [Ancylobacter sp. VNQ12]|uniref:P-loop NTPase fold protein n=1 Tax=Ancylobacter sp. VNQ12 TaxID=3400920 RepID=UPI003C046BE1
MSLPSIEAEIHRFLSSDVPEVLCIKGKWGVGKTYGWQKFLRAAKDDNSLKVQRYAYVSLFGLNSLDDLRYSIFQNTVSGKNIGRDADAATFEELIKDKDNSRKIAPVVEWVSAVFNRKGVSDLIAKSAFLLVRKQIVCLDDLERAGKGLGAREVLGLASLLKEERKCKVVLLLNDEEHDEKGEFERQLEKVADVTLRFDPTPDEAVSIALTSPEKAVDLLKPLIVTLGITNIRVIKKIERLARRLVEVLSGYDSRIVEESVATLVLASWSVQQPGIAPPLDFIRNYDWIGITIRVNREELDDEAVRYNNLLSEYPFRNVNGLDKAIIDGAENGYFFEAAISAAAERLVAERMAQGRNGEFSRVWEELYHGSLVTDDDEFLEELFKAAVDESAVITPLNIDGTIRMFRETGRDNQADMLIQIYVKAHEVDGFDFFNIGKHHFSQDPDKGLVAAFKAYRDAYIDYRDPLEVLLGISERQSWDDADVALMAKQSAADFERMFEELRGAEIRRAIDTIRLLGRGYEEGHEQIAKASEEALRRIAAKSPLRARKVARFGIKPAPAPIEASDTGSEEDGAEKAH